MLAAASLGIADAIRAQCQNVWTAGDPVPGLVGICESITMWDPDGSGPASAVLVCAGQFRGAGNVAARNLAAWDPSTRQWSTIGSPPTGSSVTDGDGPAVDRGNGRLAIARTASLSSEVFEWDGTTWTQLGLLGRSILAMLQLPNGHLLAGGGVDLSEWDGVQWTRVAGYAGGLVFSLDLLPNGHVLVGGTNIVTPAGPTTLADWDGTTMTSVGPSSAGRVEDVAVLPNGDIVTVGSNQSNRRWDGTAWTSLGTWSSSSLIHSIVRRPNGDLIVGGAFTTANGVVARNIARFDGTTWSAISDNRLWNSLDDVRALTLLADGSVVAGGRFNVLNVPANSVVQWDGSLWSALTSGGTNNGVLDIDFGPDGSLYAAGEFQLIGGVLASGVARRVGTTWQPLGTGLGHTAAPVAAALAVLPNGDVVCGGVFTSAGGVPVNNIARWNGSAWQAMGAIGALVRRLDVTPSGELLACVVSGSDRTGTGSLFRWNGSAWTAFNGASGMANGVPCVLGLPDGSVVMGGGFLSVAGVPCTRVARWNGSGWSPLGALPARVSSLARMPNGDLVAGCDPTSPSSVFRWDGIAWSPIGNRSTFVEDVLALPNGDVIAACNVGVGVQRWDGSNWTRVSDFVFGNLNIPEGYPFKLLADRDGDVLVAGRFSSMSETVTSAFLAEYSTTCPATAATYGAGCTGTSGPLQLVANGLPWIGSTFAAQAATFATNSVGLGLVGLSAISQPLSALHPAGVPGCDVLVNADIQTNLLFPTAGAVTTTIAIPRDLALVGLAGRMQVVQARLDAQGTIVEITSSNGLLLTVGAF